MTVRSIFLAGSRWYILHFRVTWHGIRLSTFKLPKWSIKKQRKLNPINSSVFHKGLSSLVVISYNATSLSVNKPSIVTARVLFTHQLVILRDKFSLAPDKNEARFIYIGLHASVLPGKNEQWGPEFRRISVMWKWKR